MKVDFQAEGEKGFTIYPDETYEVKAVGVERTVATTGTPQVKWTGQIMSGSYAGNKITAFTPLSEKGLWRTVQVIKAAVGLKSFKALGIMDTESSDFYNLLKRCNGKHMQWVVIQSEYNGKPKNEVTDFLPASDLMEEELTMSMDEVPEFLRDKSEEE